MDINNDFVKHIIDHTVDCTLSVTESLHIEPKNAVVNTTEDEITVCITYDNSTKGYRADCTKLTELLKCATVLYCNKDPRSDFHGIKIIIPCKLTALCTIDK